MTREKVDILISGGGIAGLVAAAALGHEGFTVLLVDPTPPIATGNTKGSDLRSTAYLQPAYDLFSEIGLWGTLAPVAVPLNALRIIDTISDPPQIRGQRAFQADDMGDQPFGWNFLNWQTRDMLLNFLSKRPGIDLRYGVGFRSVLTRTSGTVVTLTDGDQVAAKLVLGADGRFSSVREAAGISVRTTRYGQKSLAFTASHTAPHQNISTEIYHRGGPFTVVPLNDINGKPASAIVWMNKGRRAVELARMDVDTFNREMTLRSANLLGPMELESERAVWPIITQRANRLTSERIALIAEAAHVLPPIGAQGLNTSLNDITALLDATRKFPGKIGEPEMLTAYARNRETDIARRARVIDLFNRITRSGNTGLQALRFAGLKAVHDIAPLRHRIMRAGMGPA